MDHNPREKTNCPSASQEICSIYVAVIFKDAIKC
jgi:hypothetical protein